MAGKGMVPEQVNKGARRYLQIGKYQVTAHLATGGMAAVYRARDTELGREVALKVLSPEFASEPLRFERFRREARHGSKLQHENIVTLYEFGEANGIYFLALEFIEGVDLFDYIKSKGQLSNDEARLILIQAVRALRHAYSCGVVHRDIKPSNILLTEKDGELIAKLTDFGVAYEAREEEARVTGAGMTVGTIDYMAPEQARDSRSADIRSDLYSLGCTLYHMLAGRPPFDGTVLERVFKHTEAEPPDILQFNPAVSTDLIAIMRRMMGKKPADRYQSPDALLNDLYRSAAGDFLLPAEPVVPEPIVDVPLDSEETPPSITETPMPRRDKRRASSKRLKPRLETQVSEETPLPQERDSSPLVPVSADQHKAAEGQFERAKEAMAAGNNEYAIELLLSCCKLDPGNLRYRRTLRRFEKDNHTSGALGWLTNLPGKTRLRASRRAGEHRKVLEQGEEVLARNPYDVAALVEMAEAAKALGLYRVELWLMEQAQQADPGNPALSRSLAQVYETLGNFTEAIAQWENVRKVDPSDGEAFRKVRDLAARDTIARGNYTGMVPGMKKSPSA